MIFKGGTIRVVWPAVKGGNRPKYDPETKQPIFKEEFFPLTAKRAFEDRNRLLPDELKRTIEVLSGGSDETISDGGRKKPGPKPKQK